VTRGLAGDAASVDLWVHAFLACLVRRDLGEIEDVADVETVTGNLDAGEAVDGEVAERMRARGSRRDERHDDREKHEDPSQENAPFRATGAHRIEKWGLRASARR